MRSFISYHIQAIIDFNNNSIDKTSPQQCVSITGDSLNILGQLKLHILVNFLVSDNIQYECVLGWDFIKGPRKDYILVGHHGKASTWDKESMTAKLAGVTHSRVPRSSTDRLLCQSTFQSNAAVALLESAIIPPRTEMILEGKLAKSTNSKICTIEPRSDTTINARRV